MDDAKLNRMRDFGCGKPHWSPYYVEPAYSYESRAIDGDKVSMSMTKPMAHDSLSGNATPMEEVPPSRESRQGTPNNPLVPNLDLKSPDPMSNTFAMNSSSRRTSKNTIKQSSSRGQLIMTSPIAVSKNKKSPLPSSRTMSGRKTQREVAKRIEDLLEAKEKEIKELKEELKRTNARGGVR
jgi:hypothetical protein